MEPPPSLSLTLLYILISLTLVAFNAFFVAAEFAIVKVRRTRLEELAGQGIASARISILCVDQLDEYLSATQLGITLVSLALGWIGEESFFNLIVLLFPPGPLGAEEGVYHLISAGTSFFLITMLHVVLGELVPKSMAIQSAEKITLAVSKPLRWFYWGARPLINVFTWIANVILKRLGYFGFEEPAVSENELKIMMKESHEDGIISESEAQIINRAFEFSDKRTSDIMIPSERVEYLSLERPFEGNLAVTRKKMHTRFPLTKNGLDSVVGVVHMKDVLHLWQVNAQNDAFEKAARPAIFVEPGLPQDRLMKLLKEKRGHLAVVRDPKTLKTLGIVTMEDILEELVGEIQDEHGN